MSNFFQDKELDEGNVTRDLCLDTGYRFDLILASSNNNRWYRDLLGQLQNIFIHGISWPCRCSRWTALYHILHDPFDDTVRQGLCGKNIPDNKLGVLRVIVGADLLISH